MLAYVIRAFMADDSDHVGSSAAYFLSYLVGRWRSCLYFGR